MRPLPPRRLHPCPTCTQPLARHCKSPTCNWWVCISCRRFGVPTGRWVKAAS